MRLLRHLATLLVGLMLCSAPLAAQRVPPKPPSKVVPTKADTAKAPPAKPAPPSVPTTGYLQGVAIDSIHSEALTGALIEVEGTGRLGATDTLGRFLIDSIPPGSYRLIVQHPMIDTLGISLVTPTMSFIANAITRTTIAVPGEETFAALFCPAAKRTLGPGALVGRIREPDSDIPAVGARVSFVWYDPDLPGLPANLRVKKTPRVREASVAADGTYKLCGLPVTYEGKLQAQRKDGGATAEVTVSQTEGVLALRSMSVAPLPKAIAANDTGSAPVLHKGSSRVLGKVVNASGVPIGNARVGLMGTSAATLTRTNGDFVLDSLPAGTQALVVRVLGYRPTEQSVELSSRAPTRVTIKLGVFVPELTAVEVVSARDEGLQKVGWTERKRGSAGGYFIDPETIEHRKANLFTDLLRTVPGIRVQSDNGQMSVYSTRSSQGSGCVTMWVDGSQWQSLQAGDMDSFVRPEEVVAIEVYQGTSAPPQFTTVGQSCAAVVVWTKTRVETRRKR